MHFDVIKSLICLTNACSNCFKMLKFTLKITINAPTCLVLTNDDGFVKPKHVGAFIVIFNVNFNILKQFKCALVRQTKDLTTFFTHVHFVSNNNSNIIHTAVLILDVSQVDLLCHLMPQKKLWNI